MAEPKDAAVVLTSITKGGVPLGVAVAYRLEWAVQELVLQDEGGQGPAARGMTAQDLVLEVDFLAGGAVDPLSDTPQTMVIAERDSQGGTVTHTLSGMVARGFALRMDRDGGPARWRQRFVHRGAMTESPLS